MKRKPEKQVIIPLKQYNYLKKWALEGLQFEKGTNSVEFHIDPDRWIYCKELEQEIKLLKQFKPTEFISPNLGTVNAKEVGVVNSSENIGAE